MYLTPYRRPRQLIDIDDGFCTLMDDKGETRGDLRVPEGALGQQLQKDFDDGKELLVRRGRVWTMGLVGVMVVRTVKFK